MTRHFTLLVVGASICQWLLTSTLPARAASSEPARIISPHDASWMERLAAREVRRYVYLRTGERLAIVRIPMAFREEARRLVAKVWRR